VVTAVLTKSKLGYKRWPLGKYPFQVALRPHFYLEGAVACIVFLDSCDCVTRETSRGRNYENVDFLPLALPDKILLNARNMAETIIGRIKEFSALNLPKHRLPLSAFLHLLAAITAYQINPIKPKFQLPSTYPLAIPA